MALAWGHRAAHGHRLAPWTGARIGLTWRQRGRYSGGLNWQIPHCQSSWPFVIPNEIRASSG